MRNAAIYLSQEDLVVLHHALLYLSPLFISHVDYVLDVTVDRGCIPVCGA